MTDPSNGRGLDAADDGRDGPCDGAADDGEHGGTDDELDDGVPLDPDAIPAPLLVVDGSGVITAANRSVAEPLGYDPGALRGSALADVFPDLDVAALADHAADGDGYLHARGVGPAGRTRLAFAVEAQTVETATVDGVVTTDRAVTDGRRYVCVGHDPGETAGDRTLEQYERIVRTIDDGVYVLDDAFNITAVNEAATEMTGYDRQELVGSNAAMLASDDTLAQAATATEALLAGDGDAATISTTIETADGETIPIETRFAVYPFADGSHGQVGVFRDVSDRVRYERALATLNDATRRLLALETQAEVCSLVVETMIDAIGLTAAVAYSFDSETNVLHPTATAAAADAPAAADAVTLGALPVVTATDGAVWDAFLDGERRVDDSGPPVSVAGSTAVPAESTVTVPLGDHGVLWLAMDEADRQDPNTVELIDLLAAGAEAALERVDRDQRLRDRERELRDRNERLQRLERINEVIRRIDAALVGADSRAAIETAVTTHLAESPLFSFAWIGRPDGDELVPAAWAGDDQHYLDSIDRSLSRDAGPPGVRTAVSGDATVVSAITDDLRAEPWRTEAVSRGFGSALAVPLGSVDGVLTVYTDRSHGFPDPVQCALRDLGETTADAIRTVDATDRGSHDTASAASAGAARADPESEPGVATAERPDQPVELDLRVEAGECPLVRLSRRVRCRLRHEGTVALAEGTSLSVVRPESDDHAHVASVDAQLAGTRAVRPLDADDESGRFGVEAIAPTVPSTVVAAGGRIRSLVADDRGATLTVWFPADEDAEAALAALRALFGDVTVTARRAGREAADPASSFRATARSELTDRQWTVLRAAHLAGFFEWPRATTGEGVAAMLGVSQPTVSRHLRVGQANLFDLLFDG